MGKVVVVRIREYGVKGHGSFEYKNQIPLEDNIQLAILFLDFERHGANIEKAFREYQKEKSALGFPF